MVKEESGRVGRVSERASQKKGQKESKTREREKKKKKTHRKRESTSIRTSGVLKVEM